MLKRWWKRGGGLAAPAPEPQTILDNATTRTVTWQANANQVAGSWTFRRFVPVGLLGPLMEAAKADGAEEYGELVKVTNRVLLALTTAWSYGPVDEETLEREVPLLHYNVVAAMITELLIPLVPGSADAVRNYYTSL